MRCLPWKHVWEIIPGSRHLGPIGSDHMSGVFPMGWWVVDGCLRCGAIRRRELKPTEFVAMSRDEHWEEMKRIRAMSRQKSRERAGRG